MFMVDSRVVSAVVQLEWTNVDPCDTILFFTRYLLLLKFHIFISFDKCMSRPSANTCLSQPSAGVPMSQPSAETANWPAGRAGRARRAGVQATCGSRRAGSIHSLIWLE